MDHTSVRDQTESADIQRKHPIASAVAMALAGVSLLGGCASSGTMSASEQVVNARAAFLRQDYATAARILSEPAMKGDAAAQYALGYMYYYGQGVPKDLYRARAWLEHSANQGYPDAKQALALLTAYAKLPAPSAAPVAQPAPPTGLPSPSEGIPPTATPPEPANSAPSQESATPPVPVSMRCEPPTVSTTAQREAPSSAEPAGSRAVATSPAQATAERDPMQASRVPVPVPPSNQPDLGAARASAVAVEAAPLAAPRPSPGAAQPQSGAPALARETPSAPLPSRPGLQGPGALPEKAFLRGDPNSPATGAVSASGGEDSGPQGQAILAVGTLLPANGGTKKVPDEEAGQAPLSPETAKGTEKGAVASDASSVVASSEESARPNRPGSGLELAAFGAPAPNSARGSVSESTPAAHVGMTPGHNGSSKASARVSPDALGREPSSPHARVEDGGDASSLVPATFTSDELSGASVSHGVGERNQEHPRYTMHLLASSDKADLVRLVRANGLSHAVSYYKVVHSDGPRYHLILGGFDTLAEARAALNALPEGLYRNRPWINNYPEQVVIMRFDEPAGHVAELE